MIPTTLNIRDRSFNYPESNVYQKVIYRQMSVQVDKLKAFGKSPNRDELMKAVGVLEHFIKRYDEYEGLKKVSTCY